MRKTELKELYKMMFPNFPDIVTVAQLDELHPFKDHPFKILNNEEMKRMIESIRKVGTITPALARPLSEVAMSLSQGTEDLRRVRCSDLKQCR